jgi:CBS domain-containing protein
MAMLSLISRLRTCSNANSPRTKVTFFRARILEGRTKTSRPKLANWHQLLGTVSESELNRKVGGFGHDPKIELVQTELNQKTVYCFEDQTVAEAEKLMRKGNLRQLPVLTREKRTVGIVTLEDIAREEKSTRS